MLEAYDIIRRPVITEKTTDLHQLHNKYTFEVAVDANKIEIRKAVEEIYKVKVKKVNTIRVKGKVKRVRFKSGRRAEIKKAIITLLPDQMIEGYGA